MKRQAVVDNAFSDSISAEPLDRLAPVVGLDNRTTGSVANGFSNNHDLADETWLWMFAGGSGARVGTQSGVLERIKVNNVPGVGSGDNVLSDANYAFTSRGPHQSVFNMIFGSYVGDWDKESSLLRSSLADPDGYGLTTMWSARPTWFVHPTDLGEPIGGSLLLTQNNEASTGGALYSPGGIAPRGMHTSLLGDPTLRLHYFEPARGVLASPWGRDVRVEWQPSRAEGVTGYHVYRAESVAGPFARLTADPVPHFDAGPLGDSTHLWEHDDAGTGSGRWVYMVRALRLEETPGGSYHNLATGALSPAVMTGGIYGGGGQAAAAPASSSSPAPSTAQPSAQSSQSSASSPDVVRLTFSEDVEQLSKADVTFARVDRDAGDGFDETLVLADGDYDLAYDPDARTATLTVLRDFTAAENLWPVDPAAGMLPGGQWRVAVGRADTGGPGRDGIAASHIDFAAFSADADGDGVVTAGDLALILGGFGLAGADAGLFGDGDLDGDGATDADDVALALGLYADDLNLDLTGV